MNNTELTTKMFEKGAYDATELRTKAAAGAVTDTEIIDMEDAVPNFDPKKDYTDAPIGTPVQDDGQVYGLLQPHNASHYEQRPAELRALWGLKHTKNPTKAKPYVAPLGTSGLYMIDECCLVDGVVYASLVDNNAYSPIDYPANWTIAE